MSPSLMFFRLDLYLSQIYCLVVVKCHLQSLKLKEPHQTLLAMAMLTQCLTQGKTLETALIFLLFSNQFVIVKISMFSVTLMSLIIVLRYIFQSQYFFWSLIIVLTYDFQTQYCFWSLMITGVGHG